MDEFYKINDINNISELLIDARDKCYSYKLQYFPNEDDRRINMNIQRRIDSYLTFNEFMKLVNENFKKQSVFHFVFIVRDNNKPYIETGISMIYDNELREHISFIYLDIKWLSYFITKYDLT